jgi:sugar phosphate isomerase/epimerase
MIDHANGIDRRQFLQLSALAAAAGCTLGSSAFAATPGGLTYGVQLFMVRRQAEQDLAGVLKAIHQIGFTQIELYPIAYSHSAADLRKIIADAGLSSASAHVDYVGLEDKIDYIHQLGCEYLVCPMMPEQLWTSPEGFREAATQFNRWGETVRARGMKFAFHNHDYEFKPQAGGTTGFAELMKNTDPAVVKLELDCYWLMQGGQDPLAVLKQHADRAVLIHMKDRQAGATVSYNMDATSEHFTELGKGTINWSALLAQAKKQGIRYAFMDQDETAGPVLDSLKESYTYLKAQKV